MELMSAKDVKENYALSSQMMIDLINNDKIAIYTRSGKKIDFMTHQKDLEEFIFSYSPIDFLKDDEAIWDDYLAIFEFDNPDAIKLRQLAYEKEKKRLALIEIEYNHMIDRNYYFDNDITRKIIKKIFPKIIKNTTNKVLIEVPSHFVTKLPDNVMFKQIMATRLYRVNDGFKYPNSCYCIFTANNKRV